MKPNNVISLFLYNDWYFYIFRPIKQGGALHILAISGGLKDIKSQSLFTQFMTCCAASRLFTAISETFACLHLEIGLPFLGVLSLLCMT